MQHEPEEEVAGAQCRRVGRICISVSLGARSCRKIFSEEAEGKNGFTGRVLSSIQGLMKLCNHPSLVKSQAQMVQVRSTDLSIYLSI